jgi:hypothetical protein
VERLRELATSAQTETMLALAERDVDGVLSLWPSAMSTVSCSAI